MKSFLVLIALIASAFAFAGTASASEAHCENMVRGEYMIFLVDANPAVQGAFEGKLTYRDNGKSAENFNCLKGPKSGDFIWTCAKTTSEPGTLRIKIVPTPHGDWAELFVGSKVNDLTFTGTLDCRYDLE